MGRRIMQGPAYISRKRGQIFFGYSKNFQRKLSGSIEAIVDHVFQIETLMIVCKQALLRDKVMMFIRHDVRYRSR